MNLGVRDNPAILVSGHDLHDLEQLLEQNVGDRRGRLHPWRDATRPLLPAFQKYPNFVGNCGNAWWQQKEDFEAFAAPSC